MRVQGCTFGVCLSPLGLWSDGVWVNEPRRGRKPDYVGMVAGFTLSDLLALAKGPLGVTNLLLSAVPSGRRGSFSYRARIRYVRWFVY